MAHLPKDTSGCPALGDSALKRSEMLGEVGTTRMPSAEDHSKSVRAWVLCPTHHLDRNRRF
jgi:hypothetical protein